MLSKILDTAHILWMWPDAPSLIHESDSLPLQFHGSAPIQCTVSSTLDSIAFRHCKTPRLLILKAVLIVDCLRSRLYKHCFPCYNNITRPRKCHERPGPPNRLMFGQGNLTHNALQSTIPFHLAKALLRIRTLLKLSQSTTNDLSLGVISSMER